MCIGGGLSFPPCMDSAIAAVDACLYGNPPPPNNVCDQAAIICGGVPEPGMQCQGEVVCYASCIVSLNSCEVNSPALTTCFESCM